MSWSAALSSPIPLPDGGELRTLDHARAFLLKPPRPHCDAPQWQAAIEAVLLVGSHGGPTSSTA
ncbi:hypothetical protein KQX62_17060 [Rhodopseudomonas palustris]|uniref:Uncharacterized protein n=1 Tax=Rhodopseudomonas palustris TaxID=1076 RepID=A0AAX3DUU3_RHOPL|nr:hypothetical protein [Rhodopseudomonas palustris]UYO38423.1 hypothetical protein KQX62_17060 [Rhodopseudomonas palustris]